jgi:hypothetical protein
LLRQATGNQVDYPVAIAEDLGGPGPPSALLRHSIRHSSANGLLRNPMAPPSSARFRALSEKKAVMKIMGNRFPFLIRRCCRSRPVNPGICKSIIRHEVSSASPDSRNAFSGRKSGNAESQRLQKIFDRLTCERIVINDGDHGPAAHYSVRLANIYHMLPIFYSQSDFVEYT